MIVSFWPFYRKRNKTLNEVSCKGMAVVISGMVRMANPEFSTSGKDGCISIDSSSARESQCFPCVRTMTFPAALSDVLINFLREVAAAAPALPFYYYHVPALTGVKSKYCSFPQFVPRPTSYPIALRNPTPIFNPLP